MARMVDLIFEFKVYASVSKCPTEGRMQQLIEEIQGNLEKALIRATNEEVLVFHGASSSVSFE